VILIVSCVLHDGGIWYVTLIVSRVLHDGIVKMGLAFGCFNEFWWFFCFKNSGFVFNERVGLYFYDKRVASPFLSKGKKIKKGTLPFR
jgi:hypothetical protein